MVERHQKKLVGRVEQIEQKPVDRCAGIIEAAAEHAVADVEQHAETHRHTLSRELRDLLPVAVLEDLERVPRQVGHQMALAVGDRRRNAGELNAGLERALQPDRRLLRRQRGDGGDDAENRQARAHGSCYHHRPRYPLPDQDLP